MKMLKMSLNTGLKRMAKAKVLGKEKEFNRIAAYGCSFTAASETMDEDLYCHFGTRRELDEFKKKHEHYGSFNEEIDKICKGNYPEKFTWNGNKINVDHHLVKKLQKENSYVNKLAELYNVSCFNRAVPGSSVSYSIFQILSDISAGLVNPDNDLIFVGITTKGRFWSFDPTDEYNQIKHFLVGHPSHNWQSYDFHNKYVLQLGDGYTTSKNYFMELQHLSLLAKKYQIFCLDIFNIEAHLSIFETHKISKSEDPSIEDFLNLSQSTKFEEFVDLDLGEYMGHTKDEMHGFMHPTKEHHIETANKIFEFIKC